MSDPTSARTYRFPPLDRSGVLLGLSGRQCAVLGAGAVSSGWLLDRAAPALVVPIPILVALVVVFTRMGDEPICDVLPALAGFAVRMATGRRRWLADVPFTRGSVAMGHAGPAAGTSADLPPFMAGLEIIHAGPADGTVPGRVAGVGAVVDPWAGTVSGSVRVHAGGFCLADRGDQERLLAGWGDVLGGFCREGGPVSQVRWTEWFAPTTTPLAPPVTWDAADLASGVPAAASFATDVSGRLDSASAYQVLLAQAARTTTGHDVLVTVTVDQRRVHAAGRRRARRLGAALDTLIEELRLLTERLRSAGLAVDAPLSPAELADAIRRRLDPHGSVLPVPPHSLAATVGVVSSLAAGPLTTETEWSRVQVDGSVHRTFWVAEWPRLEVPPNWIEPLLLHPGGVRTVSVIYEPVPPGRSRRQVDREATKLAADEEQRTRAGFRIGARHRRQQGALAEREAELVAGFAELSFAGFVTVSAPNGEALDAASADYVQSAAQAGMDLRRLDGRHDTALLTTLPVGRGLTRRRMP